jgi:hypothetical protein
LFRTAGKRVRAVSESVSRGSVVVVAITTDIPREDRRRMRADGDFLRDEWSRVVAIGFHDVGRCPARRPVSVRFCEVPSLLTGSD